uniref:Uncharacterized protein n=1 Tax=Plectus sambesii TaxID=2011161 RepID=A0A914X6F2_9BILA
MTDLALTAGASLLKKATGLGGGGDNEDAGKKKEQTKILKESIKAGRLKTELGNERGEKEKALLQLRKNETAVESLTANFDSVRVKSQDLQLTVQQLSFQVNGREEEIRRISQQLSEKNGEVQQLKTEVEAVRLKLREEEVHRIEKSSAYDILDARFKEEEKKRQEQQLHVLQKDKELRKLNIRLEEERDKYKEQLKHKEDLIQQFNTDLESESKKYGELEDQLSQMSELHPGVRALLTDRAVLDKLQSKRTKIRDLEAKVSQLQTKLVEDQHDHDRKQREAHENVEKQLRESAQTANQKEAELKKFYERKLQNMEETSKKQEYQLLERADTANNRLLEVIKEKDTKLLEVQVESEKQLKLFFSKEESLKGEITMMKAEYENKLLQNMTTYQEQLQRQAVEYRQSCETAKTEADKQRCFYEKKLQNIDETKKQLESQLLHREDIATNRLMEVINEKDTKMLEAQVESEKQLKMFFRKEESLKGEIAMMKVEYENKIMRNNITFQEQLQQKAAEYQQNCDTAKMEMDKQKDFYEKKLQDMDENSKKQECQLLERADTANNRLLEVIKEKDMKLLEAQVESEKQLKLFFSKEESLKGEITMMKAEYENKLLRNNTSYQEQLQSQAAEYRQSCETAKMEMDKQRYFYEKKLQDMDENSKQKEFQLLERTDTASNRLLEVIKEKDTKLLEAQVESEKQLKLFFRKEESLKGEIAKMKTEYENKLLQTNTTFQEQLQIQAAEYQKNCDTAKMEMNEVKDFYEKKLQDMNEASKEKECQLLERADTASNRLLEVIKEKGAKLLEAQVESDNQLKLFFNKEESLKGEIAMMKVEHENKLLQNMTTYQEQLQRQMVEYEGKKEKIKLAMNTLKEELEKKIKETNTVAERQLQCQLNTFLHEQKHAEIVLKETQTEWDKKLQECRVNCEKQLQHQAEQSAAREEILKKEQMAIKQSFLEQIDKMTVKYLEGDQYSKTLLLETISEKDKQLTLVKAEYDRKIEEIESGHRECLSELHIQLTRSESEIKNLQIKNDELALKFSDLNAEVVKEIKKREEHANVLEVLCLQQIEMRSQGQTTRKNHQSAEQLDKFVAAIADHSKKMKNEAQRLVNDQASQSSLLAFESSVQSRSSTSIDDLSTDTTIEPLSNAPPNAEAPSDTDAILNADASASATDLSGAEVTPSDADAPLAADDSSNH